MNFEWDPVKAATNLEKHGVSFEVAASAFGDPLAITIDDPDHSIEENRFLLIGQTSTGILVVVAHADRDETIRIINARMATKHERRDYEG